jgi:OOP family OmpA-OmpF porin
MKKHFCTSSSRFVFILILNTILLLSSTTWAQQNADLDFNLSNSKMKSRARQAEKLGDVYTALYYFEVIVQRDSSDLADVYELADLYRLSRNYKQAQIYYAKVVQRDAKAYPLSLFYKAQMLKMTGQYAKAKESFLMFKKEAGNLGDKNFKTLLQRELVGCDSGIVYQEFPENVEVKNAGKEVNNPHAEFSPFLLDDNTLLYGSLRMDSVAYFDIRPGYYEKKPVRQIYIAHKVGDAWVEEGVFTTINDPNLDMGNFVYAPYSDRYYFTKCERNHKESVICKLYYTEKINDKWRQPVVLPDPINVDGFNSTQPAIVVDTTTMPTDTIRVVKTETKKNQPPVKNNNKKQPVKKGAGAKPNRTEYLYFVSDRPNGKGGMDIWYSSYNASKKTWAKPTNLGLVNTAETECTPFYHIPTQTLFFSSNGQVSAGGLDVFKTKKINGRFSKPQNLSFPINSPQDDLGYMLGTDSLVGFVVSNRPGGTPYFHETCCDDIFAIKAMPEKPFVCDLNLKVESSDTTSSIGKKLFISTYDLKTGQSYADTVLLTDSTYRLALEKNRRYAFSMDVKGYKKDTLFVETRGIAASKQVDKIYKLQVKRLESITEIMPDIPVVDKAFVLSDIQYETNKYELNNEAQVAIDSILIPFLLKHKNKVLYIMSHTDDVGSHHDNMKLSLRRAQFVVDYLIAKGINKKNLRAEGFGETKPIAPNTNPDGSVNDLGRELNRRTEFILKNY